MADNSTATSAFVRRLLPWTLAGGFLILYLITLNPWVGVNSLDVLSRLTGRDGDILLTSPLLYLLTLPIKGVSLAQLPAVANVLAALCAAGVIGILARCVNLLPHDRTREQRMRGQIDGGPLRSRFAWAPPIFAAGLLGLQLTFWEQATALTGEMLDLLVFAFLIQCLLEYRIRLKERWLWAFAAAYGAGVTNNWALIAFAPAFLIALVWIRAWSFFNAGFLIRMLLLGLAGLTLYLLTPVVLSAQRDDVSLWIGLKSIWVHQKNYLLGIPRGRALLVAAVSLLPLALVGIRWVGAKGTSMETMLNVATVAGLQIAWLAGNIFFAFDPAFSPRQMVHLDPASGGLPLLTLAFTGALASAYFLGYLLVLGSEKPEKAWDRPGTAVSGLIQLGFGLSLLATIGVPAALLFKNFPAIRSANGPVLRELADALTAPLPAQPTLVLADDAVTYGLVSFKLAATPAMPNHLVMLTPKGSSRTYRRALASRNGTDWPELQEMATQEENVAGKFMLLVARAAETNRAYYLHPSQSIPSESTWPTPAGAIQRLHLYTPDQITPPKLAAAELKSALDWWQAAQPQLDRAVAAADFGSANGRMACTVWSRAANGIGVLLQQGQLYDDAAKQFALALRLNGQNTSAKINLAVNAALKKQELPALDLEKLGSGRWPIEIINQGGPLDEPVLLTKLGRGLVTSPDRLVRRAAIAFQRAMELNPTLLGPQLGFAEACQVAGQFELALKTVKAAQKLPFEAADTLQAAYLEASALFMLKRPDEAERLLNAQLKAFPEAVQLIDLLSYYYLSIPKLEAAIPLLEQWTRLSPSDPGPLMRLTAIFMDRAQFDRALVMLETVIRINPDNIVAKANQAICLLRVDRLTEAKREYENLARKFPEEPLFQYGLGQVADKQKEPKVALRHFENYLQLAPTNTAEFSAVATRVNQLKAGQ
jgi:tetratricopeptide (TPR) repeat protein